MPEAHAGNVTPFPAHRAATVDPRIAQASAGAVAAASAAWDDLLAAQMQSLLAPLVARRDMRGLCSALAAVTLAMHAASQPATPQDNTR